MIIDQNLADLTACVEEENPALKQFEASVFSGSYVTGDINQNYLDQLHASRNDASRDNEEQDESNLALYNEAD